MPRIRKKTSARQQTRERAKVTHKVKEWKKKSKRDSKRNPTWKSKKKADPGVPNSFHLKDQVLAELENEKRLNAEQREARRLAQRAAARGDDDEDEDDKDVPGISSVGSSSVFTRQALTGTSTLPVEAPVDVPDLIDTDLPTLQAAIDRADILLEVVDARDVLGGRSAKLEELFQESGGKVVLVINKIDLVPREALQAWISACPFPTFLTSTTTPLGLTELRTALAAWSTTKRSINSESGLTVAVLGLPNVGKSALVNQLLPQATLKMATSGSAASAKHPQPTTTAPTELEVTLHGEKIHVIDTPGWEFVEDDEDEEEDEEEDGDEDEEDEEAAEEAMVEDVEDDEDGEDVDGQEGDDKWDELEARVAGDLLRRNLGRVDRVKDVFPLVNYIISRSNSTDLMLVYNVPYFESGDIQAFLTGLARVNARIKKHGEPDVESAGRILLRDWAMGTFPYYSTPPTTSVSGVEQPDMAAVLAACRGKKEMKAGGRGLVRFRGGDVDQREVFLDDDYTEVDMDGVFGAVEDEEDDEVDGEEDGDEEEDEVTEEEGETLIIGPEDGEVLDLPSGSEPSSGSDIEDEDDDDDDDDDEEEEEEEEPVGRSKRRRSRSASPVRKRTKTVVFPRVLEAPRSVASPIRDADIRPILKRPRESTGASEAAVPSKRKGAIAVAPLPSKATSATSTVAETPKVKAKEATKAKPAKADKPKASKADKAAKAGAASEEAYDFSKHFF